MTLRDTSPWTELYRPRSLDKQCMDEVSLRILTNMRETKCFPHLLLCGPPGTGKTTAVINLVFSLCDYDSSRQKAMTLHLNASDDRGVQVVRDQIETFAKTSALFKSGTKLVILDEADAMTESAQTALKQLISKHECKVRFCLICNYSHKIIPSLQFCLVQLRFRVLPRTEVKNILETIAELESSSLTNEDLDAIIEKYGTDVRSMINEMQSHSIFGSKKSTIKSCDLDYLLKSILLNPTRDIYWHIEKQGLTHRIDPYTCCKLVSKHVLNKYKVSRTRDYIDFVVGVHNLPPIGQVVGCQTFVSRFTSIFSLSSHPNELILDANLLFQELFNP